MGKSFPSRRHAGAETQKPGGGERGLMDLRENNGARQAIVTGQLDHMVTWDLHRGLGRGWE